jgi:spore germination protein GerM
MKRALAAALALGLLIFAAWKWHGRAKGPAKTAAESSPLFTGKETKIKVRLPFPAKDKPGFAVQSADIYQTSSQAAQLKQALNRLFEGPVAPGASPAFPAGFKYREVFVTDKGLAVIDLDADSVKALPGGTTSEFVALYGIVKTALDNFREIKRVQILVDGEAKESLAGHMDISGPLTLEDF